MATSCGSGCVIGSGVGEVVTGKNKVVVVCEGTRTVVVVLAIVVVVAG